MMKEQLVERALFIAKYFLLVSVMYAFLWVIFIFHRGPVQYLLTESLNPCIKKYAPQQVNRGCPHAWTQVIFNFW